MSDDKSLNVLLKPHSNSNNKKILDYLHENQKKINSNDMLIKPLIMNPDKIDEFVKIGVNNLPSLLYNGKIVYGVNEIIKYINKLCTKEEKNSKIKRNDDEDIRDYMLAHAKEDDDEMESPISDKEIRNNRFSKHKNNQKNNNSSTEYDYNNDDNNNSDDEEEDIMTNYWKNTEETVI